MGLTTGEEVTATSADRPPSHAGTEPGPAHAAPGHRRGWLLALLVALVVGGTMLASWQRDGGDQEPVDTTAPAGEVRPDPTEEAGDETPAVAALGFHPLHPANDGIDLFVEMERELNRDIGFMVQFGDGRDVDAFRNNLNGQFSDRQLGRYDGSPPFRLSYSVPLAFGERHDGSVKGVRSILEQFDALIEDTGDRQQVYRETAQKLADAGFDDAIIRLGWEFDNPSSRWYAGVDPDRFKAAWRVVHGIFRDVSPDFQFDYNPTRGGALSPLFEEAYPGDEYVDIVGLDVYDAGYEGPGGVAPGNDVGWADPEMVWEEHHRPALEAHRDFAERHGKPVSFPEWGLSGGGRDKEGKAGGDNPTFIKNMYDWLNEVAGDAGPGLVYHSYFQFDDGPSGPHSIESFSESEREFTALFGR